MSDGGPCRSTFGAIDDWFSHYATPKYVRIHDRTLGYSHRIFQILIVLYIFVYTCGYQCLHLAKVPVFGTTRISIQQPVEHCNPMEHDCNSDFRARNDLPYCEHSASGPKNESSAIHCAYWDGIGLTNKIPVPGTFFVPTRIMKWLQTRDCFPDAEEDFGCNTTIFRSPPMTEKQNSFYVADVDRFTFLFGHGFEARDSNTGSVIRGQCTGVKGVIHAPDGDVEIPDKPVDNSTFPSLFRLKHNGDVISLADLVKATNENEVSLDTVRDAENNFSLRWQGGVINVRMHYSNKKHWDVRGGGALSYQMSARLQPLAEFKQMYGTTSADGMHRTVTDAHGILVNVEVRGDYYVFDWVFFLQMLTASFAMLVIARMVVDFFMAHVGYKSKNYRLLKYQNAKAEHQGEEERNGGVNVQNILNDMRKGNIENIRDDQRLLDVLLHLDHRLNYLDAYNADAVEGEQGYTRLTNNNSTSSSLP